MIATGPTYRTELLKVSGIVSETIALLDLWEPGMTAPELARVAVERDVLGKATASRVKDVIYQGFAKRYLRPNEEPARLLRELAQRKVELHTLKQLFFLYTCRSQLILSDFVTLTYWPRAKAGLHELSVEESLHFVVGSFRTERLPGRWASSLVKKMSSNLLKTLADFGLLGPYRRFARQFLPFPLSPFAFRFILHEMHFGGRSDTAIVESSEWQLFGLDRAEVVDLIRREAAATGAFIFQHSGDLARFSWKSKSMEEFLGAHT